MSNKLESEARIRDDPSHMLQEAQFSPTIINFRHHGISHGDYCRGYSAGGGKACALDLANKVGSKSGGRSRFSRNPHALAFVLAEDPGRIHMPRLVSAVGQ